MDRKIVLKVGKFLTQIKLNSKASPHVPSGISVRVTHVITSKGYFMPCLHFRVVNATIYEDKVSVT